MVRNFFVAIIFCGFVIVGTGCDGCDNGQNGNTNPGYCGNGWVDYSRYEECDGYDLAGRTCADVVPGSTGTLACDSSCWFDTSGCTLASCGDGVLDTGEACDCGTDPSDLPWGCTGINGATGANCTENCGQPAFCGDGFVTIGVEECDCGNDASNLPTGCDGVNGAEDAACLADCTLYRCGTSDVWDSCDPADIDTCCPDDWGVPLQCKALPTTGEPLVCWRACLDASDCFQNNYCLGPQADDLCWPATCAPGYDIDAELSSPCQIPGGGQGWCAPIYGGSSDPAEEPFGLCVEEGTLQQGDACVETSLVETDRSAVACSLGLCRVPMGQSTGNCVQFCNWEDAYAVAVYGADPSTEPLACPTGTNCFTEVYVSHTTGYTSGPLAYCQDSVATSPATGISTCSLVTNQLLSSSSLSCGDVYTDGRCELIRISAIQDADGALVGACAAGLPSTRAVWEQCNAATDICPSGSICVAQDVFDANSVGPDRCVPYCDTAFHDGTQSDCPALGAVDTGDGTPVCTTVSALHVPGIAAGSSRLGLCGL
ncbi:MAG: hypothetical protein ABI333_15140 [bacterium]